MSLSLHLCRPLRLPLLLNYTYSLLNILKKYDSEDVFRAIDVIAFKHEQGDAISSFSGLLVYMLKNGIVLPENYVPYIERSKKKIHLMKLKEKQEAKRQKVDAENMLKREQAENKYKALSSGEKVTLKIKTKNELPLILQRLDRCVYEKMIDLLMR